MSGLQGQTGSSPTEMRAELERMMPSLQGSIDQMSEWEQRFVTDMADSLIGDEWVPTPKQLFKARDLNTKY